jgi:hypothetical protein
MSASIKQHRQPSPQNEKASSIGEFPLDGEAAKGTGSPHLHLEPSVASQKFLYKLHRDPTPCRGAVFQAAIKFVQSHLDGTIRLIVSPGSPKRLDSPTGMLPCACPAIDIGTVGVSFKMRKRRDIGKDHAKGGREGGRRGYISHTHIRPCVAIFGRPSARLTHDVKLITGQRSLRFSILKETPTAPRKATEAILRL